jgi:hypothetical protein
MRQRVLDLVKSLIVQGDAGKSGQNEQLLP